MKPIRVVIVALAVLALGIACWRFAPQSLRQKAYRICETCGMSEGEVDGLVSTFAHAAESREALLTLYRQTFDDPAKVDCEDCSEAILDAAKVP